jgi:hypothetical protein
VNKADLDLALVLSAARRRHGDRRPLVSAKGPCVLSIGGLSAPRVTVASQQARAINAALAVAFARSDRKEKCGDGLKNDHVVVLGGGAAGMTFAVAAHRLKAKSVTIVEQANRWMPAQWKSYDRYLHPNLFHWPDEQWREPKAKLPVLDWKADYANRVRDKLEEQFLDEDDITHLLSTIAYGHIEVDDTRARIRIARSPDYHDPAWLEGTVVAVATGFPSERVPRDIPTKARPFGGSYWRTDASSLTVAPGETVDIAGNGDGALTELMALAIPTFQQSSLQVFASELNSKVGDDLRLLDLLWTEAEALDLDASYVQELRDALPDVPLSKRRPAARVNVIGRGSPSKVLTSGSFLLNRCGALALERDAFGAIKLDVEPGGYDLANADPGRRVVWRIGPSTDRMETFGVEAARPAKDREKGVLNLLTDLTRQHLWNPKLFPTGTLAKPVKNGTLVKVTNGFPEIPLNGDAGDVFTALYALESATPIIRSIGILDDTVVRDRRVPPKQVMAGRRGTRVTVFAVDAVAALADLTPRCVLRVVEHASTLELWTDSTTGCAYVRRTSTKTVSASIHGIPLHLVVDTTKVFERIEKEGWFAALKSLLRDGAGAIALELAVRAHRDDPNLARYVIRVLSEPAGVEFDERHQRLVKICALALANPDPRERHGHSPRWGLMILARACNRAPVLARPIAEMIGTDPRDVPDLFVIAAAGTVRRVGFARPVGVTPGLVDKWLDTAYALSRGSFPHLDPQARRVLEAADVFGAAQVAANLSEDEVGPEYGPPRPDPSVGATDRTADRETTLEALTAAGIEPHLAELALNRIGLTLEPSSALQG